MALSAPSAYQIEQAMAAAMAAAARIQADGAEATDEAELLAALAAEGAPIDDILTRLIRAAMEADALAEAATARIEAITERRARFRNHRDTWRAAAFAVMDALGLKTLKAADFTASVSAGRPAVIVTDEAAIPADYVKTTTVIDKAALAAALRQGEVVPGAELSNPIPSLTIRSK